MRRVSNVFVWLGAAAVCAVMTWITMDSSLSAVISNLAFLAVMAVIILIAAAFGFRRMNKTIGGLNTAQEKLVSVYKNRNELVDITKPGAEIFRVEYLDRKYQEYLGYLRKTNSPCDIGDYIGEYEINNYTHRRLVEMVPDILTSLGILGTFMGLVWGLRGFNPVSYEAMASSITSLINGIKVAFITSIYGIVLALAFQYTLRGKLTGMSEALDGTDQGYAVPRCRCRRAGSVIGGGAYGPADQQYNAEHADAYGYDDRHAGTGAGECSRQGFKCYEKGICFRIC